MMSILFKKNDSLDMVCLGKHIYRVDLPDNEIIFAQIIQIPAEGRGIAGNVYHPLPAKGGEVWGESWNSLAGRIDNQAIETVFIGHQFLTDFVDRAFYKSGVGKPGVATVSPGTSNSGSLTFHAE
jgi:hypothetical protein